MKKIILFFVILFSLSVNSLNVSLDLNTYSGNEPLDVNLTATILEGTQTKTCIDNNDCGTENDKPETFQICGPCANGSTMPCTTIEDCPGTQTCSGGTWGSCIDDPTDECPLIGPTIFVEQITPIEDITITQNTPFTFQTKVKCLGGDCGNITATLDPEITKEVETGTDDAYIYETTIQTATVYNRIGQSSSIGPYTAGLRFNSISIPTGSTIDSAAIALNSRDTETGIPLNVMFRTEISENPATFSTYSDFASRTKSTSFVEWNNVPAFTTNTIYNTPDLSSIIQEVIDSSYWDEGDSIVIFIEDNGSAPGARRNIKSYDFTYEADPEPILTINYSVSETFKGVIPMNSGTPFYTTNLNPQTCSNLLEGEECINTWSVMPTGTLGNSYEFFVDYVPEDIGITTKRTSTLNLTIGAEESCVDSDGDLFNAYNSVNCYSGTDCDDLNPNVNSGETEICDNGIDDNCNGEIDEECTACEEQWVCGNWSECTQGTPPYIFEWDFEGNGTIDATTNSPENSLMHSYLTGYYNPKIKVTDQLMREGENTRYLKVALANGNFLPIVDAGETYKTFPGTGITLASHSSDDGSIIQYLWEIKVLKGTPDCSINNSVIPNPEVTCNGIGTIELTLTVTDNLGAQSIDTTTLRVVQTQTADLINVVNIKVEPETVKSGEDLQVIVTVRNESKDNQELKIIYSITNMEKTELFLDGKELLDLEVEAYGQKDFVITITAQELQDEAKLNTMQNYWVYATAEAGNPEANKNFNTRRATFSFNESSLEPVNADETSNITLGIVIFSLILILTKKERIKNKKTL